MQHSSIIYSSFIYLGVAIACEVAATLALKSVQGFQKLIPLCVVVVGYSLAFLFLSFALRSIPVGVAYAIWSGVGVIFITLIAAWLYRQHIDLAASLGIALIIIGVVVIKMFSKMSV